LRTYADCRELGFYNRFNNVQNTKLLTSKLPPKEFSKWCAMTKIDPDLSVKDFAIRRSPVAARIADGMRAHGNKQLDPVREKEKKREKKKREKDKKDQQGGLMVQPQWSASTSASD